MKPCWLLWILLGAVQVLGEAILNGLPVTFSMGGPTQFTPDVGGSQQSGYVLTMGYVGASWLGVEFVGTGTSSDFLLLTISDFYSGNANPANAGHQVSYQDYYVNANGSLLADSITTYDISSYGFSSSKIYNLQVTRFVGSNQG